MIPNKINRENEIHIIAPSGSLSRVRPDIYENALGFLREKGFKVTFSENCREMNEFYSSSVSSRVDDLHKAFSDKNVSVIMACIGGFNVNEILPHLDYDLIKANPKIICGYSDITALLNAIYAKTGLVTYHSSSVGCNGYS